MQFITDLWFARVTHKLTVCALLIILSASFAVGQEGRGTIVGRILDPSGAAVPGAPVVVTNKAMGTAISQSAGETGYYQATLLIPGMYEIAVEMPGFKKVVIRAAIRDCA